MQSGVGNCVVSDSAYDVSWLSDTVAVSDESASSASMALSLFSF